MALENITPEEQLTINHINNLHAAVEIGHCDILYTNIANNSVPVSVSIIEENREVEIKFLDKDWEAERTTLRDYSYLMSILIIS